MQNNRYQIIEELGRGGMGVVYKAHDQELNRAVALKFIFEQNPTNLQRFQREAQTIARLKHPNIINILDIGVIDGKYFFAMDFISGSSLSYLIKNNKVTARNVVKMMIKIGEAVHHAHRGGIIHRDLKPENIMITSEGEPIVMDFGLAFSQENSLELSKSGVVMGTLAYMSPEQLKGRKDEIDKRSDVYSLGAILYEMLTGRAPFLGTASNLVHQILHKLPLPPRKIKPQVSKDMEYVCLKAMEKNKEYRYISAKAMAEDLKKIDKGEIVYSSSAFLKSSMIGLKNISQTKHIRQYIIFFNILVLSFLLGICYSSYISPYFLDWNTIFPVSSWKQFSRSEQAEFLDIWQKCWNEEAGYFDFSAPEWKQIKESRQRKYAQFYREYYAFSHQLDTKKLFPIANHTIEMSLIPPGKFTMNITPYNLTEEQIIDYPFFIAQKPITMDVWQKVMQDADVNNSSILVNAPWQDCHSFCLLSGLALPMETEWEYACRSGNTISFPAKMENAWECTDMISDIGEWCQDIASITNIEKSKEQFVSPKSYININSYANHSIAHVVRGGNPQNEVKSETLRYYSQDKKTNIGFRPIIRMMSMKKNSYHNSMTIFADVSIQFSKIKSNKLELKSSKVEVAETYLYWLTNQPITFSFNLPETNSKMWMQVKYQSADTHQHFYINNEKFSFVSIPNQVMTQNFYLPAETKKIGENTVTIEGNIGHKFFMLELFVERSSFGK